MPFKTRLLTGVHIRTAKCSEIKNKTSARVGRVQITKPPAYVENVLRLIRGQDVDGDLLTVGEADVEGDFFYGNLLSLLWEGHGDNTQHSWLCAVFSFLWVNNEIAMKTCRARFLFSEAKATFTQD